MPSSDENNVEELLKKANEPGKKALELHPYYRGKLQVMPKAPINSMDDFGIWYTPGVAQPCLEISKDPSKSFVHTNRWNAVAVVSDGTRVLGLGDIGPEAAMPVMEGKAMLFKYLGGVDAYPICLDTKDTDEIIRTVKLLKPTFGGINLEDLSSPKCFEILDRLREDPEMDIPVWHDDQQGTATIQVAGAMNALELVGKKWAESLFTLVGTGAANIATARVLNAAGVPWKNMLMMDSKGILGEHRRDLEENRKHHPLKWDLARKTNGEGREGGITEAMSGADIVIAASKPGPGTITKKQVQGMANDAIVFASANPVPEIWPWEAEEAGARIIATGRSDFPNQINNSLGFPGIFRGTLDVNATTITDGMCIAAAEELAKVAKDKGLREDYIVPTMDEWEVFPREAAAVGVQAIIDGVARNKLTHQELLEMAEFLIRNGRESTKLLQHSEMYGPRR